jgi:hypothetical protein
MLTLLTITGTTIALTAVYTLIVKSQPASVLAGETTLSSSADPASETLSTAPSSAPTGAPCSEWQLTTVSDLSDAEELLDVLENQGIVERELVILGNSTFAVRWR